MRPGRPLQTIYLGRRLRSKLFDAEQALRRRAQAARLTRDCPSSHSLTPDPALRTMGGPKAADEYLDMAACVAYL